MPKSNSNSVIAIIREDACIGCTKCIQACPVDAIVGAANLMHTVITDECIGCKLCIAPCPVDCIDLISIPALEMDNKVRSQKIRQRYSARKQRLSSQNTPATTQNKNDRISEITAALQRKKLFPDERQNSR